jgi:hypothetical protein
MREQGMFDPARLVFVDETAANTKMVRLIVDCRTYNTKKIATGEKFQ